MYLLTIAIPVYNMEKYLARCLDSVADTALAEDVEVLIINDGSTDNSLAIAKEYAQKHKNFVVIDKENGGWGTAINRGIKEARGKYFRNLDSDDWFKDGSLVKVVDELKKGIDSDLILTPFTEIYEGGEDKVISYLEPLCGKTMDFEEYMIATGIKPNCPIHSLTIKTSILQDNNIQILPRYYTDIEYTLSALQYVRTIHIIPIELYQYYLGREGQSVSLESYFKHLDDHSCLCKRLCALYMGCKNQVSDSLRFFLNKSVMGRIQFNYYLLMVYPRKKTAIDRPKLLRDFDRNLKKDFPELYKASDKLKKKGIPFIWLWRKTRINLFYFR